MIPPIHSFFLYNMAQITIHLKGKDYPCRLTMGALLAYKRETGHDFGTDLKESESQKDIDIESLLMLLGLCLESTCKADGKVLPEGFSAKDIADYINIDDVQKFWSKSEGNL